MSAPNGFFERISLSTNENEPERKIQNNIFLIHALYSLSGMVLTLRYGALNTRTRIKLATLIDMSTIRTLCWSIKVKNIGCFILPTVAVLIFTSLANRSPRSISADGIARLQSIKDEKLDAASTRKLDDAICPYRLGPTRQDDLNKIDSYRFYGIEEYLRDLFPPLPAELPEQELPVFVMAFSSNHFEEGMGKLERLKNETLPYYNLKVIFYDIGLRKGQLEQVRGLCSCETRQFPFHNFPPHVKRNLQNYAWKPIVIQERLDIISYMYTEPNNNMNKRDKRLWFCCKDASISGVSALFAIVILVASVTVERTVLKEYRFVMWMDTSHKFKTHHLDELFAEVKRKGFMANDNGESLSLINTIPERTQKSTFDYLQEHPCTFRFQFEKEGGFVLLYNSHFVTRYFMRPWVSCALAVGCMEPLGYNFFILTCPTNPRMFEWHRCHRFDQSVLGILYTRLFHNNLAEHRVDGKYFKFH